MRREGSFAQIKARSFPRLILPQDSRGLTTCRESARALGRSKVIFQRGETQLGGNINFTE